MGVKEIIFIVIKLGTCCSHRGIVVFPLYFLSAFFHWFLCSNPHQAVNILLSTPKFILPTRWSSNITFQVRTEMLCDLS